jgi:hypothetical protein
MFPLPMTASFCLIGLAGVVVAVGGVMLVPRGERLVALFALVAGAGVGIAALAIGARIADQDHGSYEDVFLVASVLGFVATIATLVAVIVVTRRDVRLSDPAV